MDKNKKFFEMINEKFYGSRDFNKYEAVECIADAFDDEKDLDEYNASVDYRTVAEKIMDEASRLTDDARDAGLEKEASQLSDLYHHMHYYLSKYAEA